MEVIKGGVMFIGNLPLKFTEEMSLLKEPSKTLTFRHMRVKASMLAQEAFYNRIDRRYKAKVEPSPILIELKREKEILKRKLADIQSKIDFLSQDRSDL